MHFWDYGRKGKEMDWWRGCRWSRECCSRHGNIDVERRRNRARHQIITADEVFDATAQPHVSELEYVFPGEDVWLAHDENERNLTCIEFDGCYTTGTS